MKKLLLLLTILISLVLNAQENNKTFTFENGDTYTGQWKDGKMHGYGTYISADGSKFVGEYKDNKRNGHGTGVFSNGNRYEGEWIDDFFLKGTYSYNKEGSKYIGEFKKYMRHGQGTMIWPNGDKYVGEWQYLGRHGQGTFTSSDGTKYEGEWKKGKRDGIGAYYDSNGKKEIAEWKEDIKIKVLPNYTTETSDELYECYCKIYENKAPVKFKYNRTKKTLIQIDGNTEIPYHIGEKDNKIYAESTDIISISHLILTLGKHIDGAFGITSFVYKEVSPFYPDISSQGKCRKKL